MAEHWAEWLGIELNHGKRESALTATRHLGFFIDLGQKVIAATKKHRSTILGYFSKFLCAVRRGKAVRVKSIQKLLGLQI